MRPLTIFLPIWLALFGHAPIAIGMEQRPIDPGTAQEHFDRANEAYQSGDFPKALAEFRESYKLSKEVELLHNMAIIAERLGDFAEAIALSHQILDSVKNRKDDDTTKPAGADITDAALGRIGRLSPVIQSSRASPGVASRREAPKTPLVLLGVGGAALLGSIGTGAAGFALARSVEGRPITPAELAGANQTGNGLNLAGGVLLGTGLALGLSGSIWLVIWKIHGQQHRTP